MEELLTENVLNVLKAVGVLVGAMVALISIRKVEPTLRPRSKLKADLEILQMLRPEIHEDEVVKQVKNHIETRIYHLYAPQREVNWWRLILATMFFLGFSFWTVYLVLDESFGLAIVGGFFALVCFGLIITATKTKRMVQPPPEEDSESSDNQ